MPNFFDKYPYTDFHELNLDWILETVKKLVADWEDFHTTMTTEWESVESAWISLRDFVTDYFANLNLQTEVNNKIDQMAHDGTLDAILLPYFNTYKADINLIVSTQNDRITVLEGRMDTFASLPPGSTSGNAELLDIRVGADGHVYDSAGDAVRGQVDAINNNIAMLHPPVDIYSENDSPSYAADSGYVYIINELDLQPGTIIKSITVYTKNNSSKTFTLSFWNTLLGTKIEETTYTMTPDDYQMVIELNKAITVPTKIGIYSAGSCETVTSKYGRNILKLTTSDTNLSDATFVNNYVLNMIVTTYSSSTILQAEIHVGDNLPFTEIQDAIESVTGEYATIIVHPKDTPYNRFSLMRKLSESYPWSGIPTVKHISIIGIDKTKCIIESDTGNYETPPAEIATNGIIKNLTFIATHSASDGTETSGSYAVHVDNRPADLNGMKLIFENCDFISYQTAAVGLGLYKNQDISFNNCNFISNTDITWDPSSDYDPAAMCSNGAFYMHTTMGYPGGNMFIRFRDCLLKHTGGSYSMLISDADTPQTALMEAINNTLWDVDNNNSGYREGGYSIMKMPYNHGNNASALNQ